MRVKIDAIGLLFPQFDIGLTKVPVLAINLQTNGNNESFILLKIEIIINKQNGLILTTCRIANFNNRYKLTA